MNGDSHKKIALVTWFEAENFGTALQAYALYQAIAQMGYSVFFLRKIGVVRSIKQFFRRLCPLGAKNIPPTASVSASLVADYTVVDFYTIAPVHCCINRNTDVCITGSDQIWNSMFFWDPFYYLYFAKHTKKVAYGSSIGAKQINPKHCKQVKKYLSRFAHIGVRERSSVEVLASLLQRNDIVSVPDPTFLLSAETWKHFGEKAVFTLPVPEKYIFAYFIGNEQSDTYNQMINRVRELYHIAYMVVVPSPESGVVIQTADTDTIYTDADAHTFVRLLQNAAVVCTDSFHAVALSINLGKEFYVAKRFLDNSSISQNGRITDLLSHYGITERLYCGDISTDRTCINSTALRNIIEEDREYGMRYLKNSIEQ